MKAGIIFARMSDKAMLLLPFLLSLFSYTKEAREAPCFFYASSELEHVMLDWDSKMATGDIAKALKWRTSNYGL